MPLFLIIGIAPTAAWHVPEASLKMYLIAIMTLFVTMPFLMMPRIQMLPIIKFPMDKVLLILNFILFVYLVSNQTIGLSYRYDSTIRESGSIVIIARQIFNMTLLYVLLTHLWHRKTGYAKRTSYILLLLQLPFVDGVGAALGLSALFGLLMLSTRFKKSVSVKVTIKLLALIGILLFLVLFGFSVKWGRWPNQEDLGLIMHLTQWGSFRIFMSQILWFNLDSVDASVDVLRILNENFHYRLNLLLGNDPAKPALNTISHAHYFNMSLKDNLLNAGVPVGNLGGSYYLTNGNSILTVLASLPVYLFIRRVIDLAGDGSKMSALEILVAWYILQPLFQNPWDNFLIFTPGITFIAGFVIISIFRQSVPKLGMETIDKS